MSDEEIKMDFDIKVKVAPKGEERPFCEKISTCPTYKARVIPPRIELGSKV